MSFPKMLSRHRFGLKLHSRSCVFLFAFWSISLPWAAAAMPPAWTGAFSAGGDGFTLANSIKVAPGGDFYVTGQFSSVARFSSTTLVSGGGADIFLAKFSSSGSLLWIVRAGGSGDDVGRALDLDADGNVFVTGWFNQASTFESRNGAITWATGYGNTIFLARYSPNGNLAWVQTGLTSSPGNDNFGYGLALDPAAGTIYLLALSQDTTTFTSRNYTYTTVTGSSSWHMVLAQYGTDGNVRWVQTNRASGNSVPYGIAVDKAGNAYVTGWFESQAYFSGSNGNELVVNGFSPAGTTSDYPDDIFLIRYDSQGNPIWVNDIGGYKAIGNGVAVSPDGTEVTVVGYIGNVDVAGSTATVVTSQPPRRNFILGDLYITSPYNADALVATYTSQGVLKHALRVGQGGNEDAKAVTYDANGDLYVAGIAQQSPTYRANLFIRKFHDGSSVWEQKAESSALWISEGTAPAITVAENGAIYVAGGYQYWARFGPSTLTSHNLSSMFVATLANQ